ncbi:MAG: hypothetical protein AAB508_06040 [Patescibacteria group bacterium]
MKIVSFSLVSRIVRVTEVISTTLLIQAEKETLMKFNRLPFYFVAAALSFAVGMMAFIVQSGFGYSANQAILKADYRTGGMFVTKPVTVTRITSSGPFSLVLENGTIVAEGIYTVIPTEGPLFEAKGPIELSGTTLVKNDAVTLNFQFEDDGYKDVSFFLRTDKKLNALLLSVALAAFGLTLLILIINQWFEKQSNKV